MRIIISGIIVGVVVLVGFLALFSVGGGSFPDRRHGR